MHGNKRDLMMLRNDVTIISGKSVFSTYTDFITFRGIMARGRQRFWRTCFWVFLYARMILCNKSKRK